MAKSGMTNYKALQVLKRLFGAVAYTEPTVLYFGVSTTEVNIDGTGRTEPTDPAYARVAVDNNSASFSDFVTGVGRKNIIDIEFPTATVSQGTITYLFIADALTVGNIMYYAELLVPKVVSVDDVLRIRQDDFRAQFIPTT